MCDNSLVLFNHAYELHKNELNEEEIIYDSDAIPGPPGPDPPTSIKHNNGYIEFKVHNQNDKIIRQTHEYFCCSINKVKRCLFTCILNILNDATGYTSRVGVFDDHVNKTAAHDVGGCGYFFALIDGVLNIGIRNGITDNGTDTLITQTDFNCNPYPEGDWTQIYTYEIEYSAKGEAYFSVNTGNGIILLHYHKDSDDRSPQIIRTNLPIRYELFKTGIHANVGEMRIYANQICCTNKFNHCDKPYSCNDISLGRRKLFSIPKLICRGYIKIRSHTHTGGSSNNSSSHGGGSGSGSHGSTGNHHGKKHSSHHNHSHRTPNGTGSRTECMTKYHTPHTRHNHICAVCHHSKSSRCRHSSHTGHSSSKSTTFKSSKCTKNGCNYHHHKQIFKQCREYVPLFSIRLTAKCNRACIKKFSLIAHLKNEDKGFILSIIKNPIFIGIIPHCWESVPNACIEYDINGNHLCQTKIDIVYQQWIMVPSSGFLRIDFNFIEQIFEKFVSFSSNIAGEPNIYTFVGQRIASINPDVLLSIEWYE